MFKVGVAFQQYGYVVGKGAVYFAAWRLALKVALILLAGCDYGEFCALGVALGLLDCDAPRRGEGMIGASNVEQELGVYLCHLIFLDSTAETGVNNYK